MEKKKNLPLVYFIMAEDEETKDCVSAISSVLEPAIEENFMLFAAENETNSPITIKQEIQFKTASEDKRIVTGPIMIPGKEMYRNDESGEYYGVFTKETIEQIRNRFAKNKRTDKVTIEHQFGVDGIFMVENWMVKDPKSGDHKTLGFPDFPEGTWMGSFFVEDEKLWKDYYKTGKVKGFSVEGLFGMVKPQKMAAVRCLSDQTMNRIKMKKLILDEFVSKNVQSKGKLNVKYERYTGQCNCCI